MDQEKVFSMKVSDVYPLLVKKAEKKGRSREEVDRVICWLTGYDQAELEKQLQRGVSYRDFFDEAPYINEKAYQITGKICGVQVETIGNPLMQRIRWLDKLVDELAKGKPVYKVCRTASEDYPVFSFDAVLIRNGDMDAGYVEVPLDVPRTFGKKKVPVHATFDGVPYDGQVVRMGTPCHIIGVRKDIRKQIGKNFGDTLHVTLQERVK